MDMLRKLGRGGAINVVDNMKVERERTALTAVARWASDCLGHDDLQASANQRRVLAAFESGGSAEQIVADLGTQVEIAGKPSLASFASIVFAQAMHGVASPVGAMRDGAAGSSRFR